MRKLYTDHRDVLRSRFTFASFYLIPLLILHPLLVASFEPLDSKRIWLLMPLATVVALVGTPEPVRIYNDISGPTSLKSTPIQAILAFFSLALHTAPLFLVNTDVFALQRSVTDPTAVFASVMVLMPFLAYYLWKDAWPYASDPVSMLSLVLAFVAVRRTTSLRESFPQIFSPRLVGLVALVAFVAVLIFPSSWLASDSSQKKEPQDCLRAPQPTRETHYDFIVDVRTENERRLLGAHARSIHLPIQGLTKDQVVQAVGAAESRIRILTYCNTATRAKDAAQLIRSWGFPYTFYHPGTWDTIER